MLWHFPPTQKQLAATMCFSLVGVALIAVGVHLSYANVAPQQARAQARREFVQEVWRLTRNVYNNSDQEELSDSTGLLKHGFTSKLGIRRRIRRKDGFCY